MRFTFREIVLAIALVAVFVASFLDRLILKEALRAATQRVTVATVDAAK